MRKEYEMTEEDCQTLLDASPQENANRAWQALGVKMGFDYMSVRPVPGKGNRIFSAEPSQQEQQLAAQSATEMAANFDKHYWENFKDKPCPVCGCTGEEVV